MKSLTMAVASGKTVGKIGKQAERLDQTALVVESMAPAPLPLALLTA